MTVVRTAIVDDAPACAAIYGSYVVDSVITFELEAPDAAAMAARIATAQQRYVWLVAEQFGEVVGYAYGSSWRERPAYRFSCETTVYLRQGLRRTGAGRVLMEALLEQLASLGYRRALAAVTLPNEASVGLHEALGYRAAGRFHRVGWKFGSWHDVGWWQRDLQDQDQDSKPPE